MVSHHRPDRSILSSFVKCRLLWLGFAAQKCYSKCLWYLQTRITPAGVFGKIYAMELEDCCNGVPAKTSGFISKHVSEFTQNFESDWFLPTWERGTWIGDDGVLDAGQGGPLTCVRRICMRFDIALTQLWGFLHDAGFYPYRLPRE